ncbi:hypothetical protein AB6B38_13165 [Glycocaulis abyssi]|uniref:Uncharacterized protein n=1 Tax=Glycocaulis abyssi TaxID=1433403 RepID=A0ABV9NDG4_9PROT
MFSIFPKLSISMIIYAIVAFTFGTDAMGSRLFEIPMMSGANWGLTPGDLILMLALFFLFIEMVKSSDTGTASIINHGMSMLVFVAGLVLFLLIPQFASSTFFLLVLMALLDTVAGFIVTIVAARRDLAVGGDA